MHSPYNQREKRHRGRNLSPLSFTDVERGLYTNAILGVYELNQVDLLRDVFIWAYERSAAHIAPVHAETR